MLKSTPEDFLVEEIPAYEPSGRGEHLFLWIEKRDVSSEQLTRHISRTFGISTREIGIAGMKDRRAITRQYVSVPARCANSVEKIDSEAVHVLRVAAHTNKLRTGHLKGNRFSILVREVSVAAEERARAIAERIRRLGFPNYFGTQRFGVGGETAQLGLDLLQGRKRPQDLPHSRRKFLLRLALSAVQSVLFNQALANRIIDGLLHRVLPGDVLCVVCSGGCFVVQDTPTEQRRLDAGETAVSGPMFGPKMKQPLGAAAERENIVLETFGLRAEDFSRFPKLTRGTRRAYPIRPGELCIEPDADGLRFRFFLPSGSYATELLREFQKKETFAAGNAGTQTAAD